MKDSNKFTDSNISPNTLPAFGIDLGTTNSCICVVSNSGVSKSIALDERGSVTMPSCVLWDGNKNEFIVGEVAYVNRNKPNACYSVKRLMGTDKVVTFTHGKKKITKTPAEVSALILAELVKRASRIHKGIKDVVITVPAEFSTKQVADTLLAAEIAELNVLNIMREPTAASLVYKLDQKPGNVLVYDLGGGTFDVSVVSIEKGSSGESDVFNLLGIESEKSKDSVTVRGTRGNTKLGGDDLDLLLYKVIEKRLKDQGCKVNLIKEEDREEMILRLESYKKLEDFKMINFNVNVTLKDKSKFKGEVAFTLEDLMEATVELFNRTKVYLDDLINSSKLNIDSIVLVGGSTKNKFLVSAIEHTYDLECCRYLNPDECVAQGAAIQAKRIKFGSDNLDVFDVTSSAIGILSEGDRVITLIEKNQSIPYSYNRTFETCVDNQEVIAVRVYEGPSIYKGDNVYLGDLVIDKIPKGKAGEVRVNVQLSIDSNGLLSCQATVGGKEKYSVTLVNILGAKVEKETKASSVMFDRWIKFAFTLENEESKNYLLDLIEESRTDQRAKVKVSKFIAEENSRREEAEMSELEKDSSQSEGE